MSTSTPNITEVRPSGVNHRSQEASMHAVVLNVTVTDVDAAAAAVRAEVVPQVSGTPGIRRRILDSARRASRDGGGCV